MKLQKKKGGAGCDRASAEGEGRGRRRAVGSD